MVVEAIKEECLPLVPSISDAVAPELPLITSLPARSLKDLPQFSLIFALMKGL